MTMLDDWNALPANEGMEPLLACCGSRAWASALVAARPHADVDGLIQQSNSIWRSLGEEDWLEAFACHPRIGESPASASHRFAAWSREEQSRASAAASPALASILDKNREYEARHGFIYIVCAEGKSAAELLAILNGRIGNPTALEIEEAAEQQRQITNLRLRRWLAS